VILGNGRAGTWFLPLRSQKEEQKKRVGGLVDISVKSRAGEGEKAGIRYRGNISRGSVQNTLEGELRGRGRFLSKKTFRTFEGRREDYER